MSFERAQAAYENMVPDDEDIVICGRCKRVPCDCEPDIQEPDWDESENDYIDLGGV